MTYDGILGLRRISRRQFTTMCQIAILPAVLPSMKLLVTAADCAPDLLQSCGGCCAGLAGSVWLQLHESLSTGTPFTATLRLCAEMPPEQRNALQGQLRALLHYHCGVQTLRTRQVMMDLQNLDLR